MSGLGFQVVLTAFRQGQSFWRILSLFSNTLSLLQLTKLIHVIQIMMNFFVTMPSASVVALYVMVNPFQSSIVSIELSI